MERIAIFEGKVPEEEKIPIIEKLLAWDKWAKDGYPVRFTSNLEIIDNRVKETPNENL